MKAYSILLWLVLFNAVLGMLGTFVPPAVDSDGNSVDPDNLSNVGGRDIFGMGSISGAIMLPNENTELANELTNQFESFKESWGTGNTAGLVTDTVTIMVLFLQLLFGIITYLPSLLIVLGVPTPIINIINVGVVIITIVALVQIITNKWFTIGE